MNEEQSNRNHYFTFSLQIISMAHQNLSITSTSSYWKTPKHSSSTTERKRVIATKSLPFKTAYPLCNNEITKLNGLNYRAFIIQLTLVAVILLQQPRHANSLAIHSTPLSMVHTTMELAIKKLCEVEVKEEWMQECMVWLRMESVITTGNRLFACFSIHLGSSRCDGTKN